MKELAKLIIDITGTVLRWCKVAVKNGWNSLQTQMAVTNEWLRYFQTAERARWRVADIVGTRLR